MLMSLNTGVRCNSKEDGRITDSSVAEGDWSRIKSKKEDKTEAWLDDYSPSDTFWLEEGETAFFDAASTDANALFDTKEFDEVFTAQAVRRILPVVVTMVDQRQMPVSPSP